MPQYSEPVLAPVFDPVPDPVSDPVLAAVDAARDCWQSTRDARGVRLLLIDALKATEG